MPKPKGQPFTVTASFIFPDGTEKKESELTLAERRAMGLRIARAMLDLCVNGRRMITP